MSDTIRVRVPASSANLGPGYDAFGLALALYNEFEATPAERWSVRVEGEGVGVLREDASNEVVRAMRRVFDEVQAYERAAEVVCHNGIPVGRGLGSSAAAIAGGIVLGNALTGERLSRARLVDIAAELEGHPDNVAAALLGGFTVSVHEGGTARAFRIEPAGGVAVVLAVGAEPLATASARGALPAEVRHADAAANAGHSALVAVGLALGDADALRAGLYDLLHERYRAPLVPGIEAVRAAFDAAGIGPAVLSGAGPSLVAVVLDDDDAAALARARKAAAAVGVALGEGWGGQVQAIGIDREGTVRVSSAA